MRLVIMLEPCDEGGFPAWVPTLPGCHTEGDTEEEAIAHGGEAIHLYLSPEER